LPTLNECTITQDLVYVIDGIFEVFVVVGTNARGDRASIRLALEFAQVGRSLCFSFASHPYRNYRAYLRMLLTTGRSRLLFML